MKIEKWQQAASALQKKMVLSINLLGKGLTLTEMEAPSDGLLKHANISVESRRFSVIMTPFSRQSEQLLRRFDFYTLYELA